MNGDGAFRGAREAATNAARRTRQMASKVWGAQRERLGKHVARWAEYDASAAKQVEQAISEWTKLQREALVYPIRVGAAVRKAWADALVVRTRK